MTVLELPAATADAVEHADWIELEAFQSSDGNCSYTEFASKIHASGTTDAMTAPEDDENPFDLGGEQSGEVAGNAWTEIERRHKACGGDDGYYPFELSDGAVTLLDGWKSSPYVFQMLLAKFGHHAGPSGSYGDRLFEELSTSAGKEYFGGAANLVCAEKFGFPRKKGNGFVAALSELCKQMNAGTVRPDAGRINDQKDSHLDVVIWRPFEDRRQSQLIGFGQCATGKNWHKGKLTELQPSNFREKWLLDGFYPEPIRLFFLPRTISDNDWRITSIEGGIIFDRCRISQLVGEPDKKVALKYSKWTRHVARSRFKKK